MFLILFLSCFAYYLHFLYPALSPRDGAELITAASTLGIAHAPGYPLYTLLGRIFSLLPFSNICYRVNLMSAFFGALIPSFIWLIIKKNNPGRFSSIAVFILAASMPVLFHESVVAEVFTINSFFAVLLCYLLATTKVNRIFILFILFVSFTNHHTIVFLVPGLLFILYREKVLPAVKKYYGTMLLAALVAFSLYFYLPLRSSNNPGLNTGAPSDHGRFIRMLLRQDYGTLRLSYDELKVYGIKEYLNSLSSFWRLVIKNTGWPALLLVIYGFIVLRKKEKKYSYFILSGFLFSGLFLTYLSRMDVSAHTEAIMERFYLLPVLLLVITAGFGLPLDKRLLIPAVFFITVSRIPVIMDLAESRKGLGFEVHDYMRNFTNSLPRNAIVFDPGDNTSFVLRYASTALKRRVDIKQAVYFKTYWGRKEIKDKYPEIFPPAGMNMTSDEFAVRLFTDNKNVFVDNPKKLLAGWDYDSRALAYQAVKGKVTQGLAETFFDGYLYITPPTVFRNINFFSREIVSYNAEALVNYALKYDLAGDFTRAENLYRRGIRYNRYLKEAYHNLGLLFFKAGKHSQAVYEWGQYLNIDPDDSDMNFNIGLSRYNIGDYLGARDMFLKAIESNPGNIRAANNYSLALYASGEKDRAIQILRKIILDYPGFQDARDNLSMMERNKQ